MPITIDNISYALPADEYTAQKVASYNSLLAAIETAWTSWTPTWTNLTVSNGTVVAKYRQIGKLIICRVSLVFGGSTSVSGSVSFSLPVTSVSYVGTANTRPLGSGSFFDTSAGDTFHGTVAWASTTTAVLRVLDASGTYLKRAVLSSSVPFTWATGDEIGLELIYEAA